MRILLSNDDGCQAPGLRCLADHLRPHAELTVVAPDRNRSGASNSLTLLNPVRIARQADGVICVDGTPTDCVHLALTGLMEQEPDMVVSGINAGPNLGDDVLYSGTVAAAMEGRHLGLPAIAVSSASSDPRHYGTAAQVTLRLIQQLQHETLPADTILNVNVPDLPYEQLNGFRVTRAGNRHRAEKAIASKDPRGRTVYWIANAGPEQDCGPGTDFHAVADGAVSITPIDTDLTHHKVLDTVDRWVRKIG
ncbi:MAG: 5'/3'-nucleotidase SurE [Nevskiales bacterium]|nr:5'/3'-nucleotidase SurE [Nevskiales bacterium]